MPVDVFALRDQVVGEYRHYVTSFINIFDDQIDSFVKKELDSGRLWPEAVLQLNPAFESGADLASLAREGVILPETARFFGESLRLYRHQDEALRLAKSRKHYLVSTGTGSGKSLTYLLPIVEVYRFPAFRPRAAVRGVFGDPKVRIVRLERRGKKLCVEPAVGARAESTIASCARYETSRRETPESIWRSRAVGCAAGVAAK